MSNKTQLQTNNTALDALITRVNAAKEVAASLPEAGSGGDVETCTVTLNYQRLSLGAVVYTTPDGAGYMNSFNNSTTGSLTIENIVKNSAFVVFAICALPYINTTEGISSFGYPATTHKIFTFNVTNDGTIILRDDD
jgi:hypothetical protein